MRHFNGHEVAFLMGWREDSKSDCVVQREHLGRRQDGYEHARVVVKHPDGKLYQFEVVYNDEYGIFPCIERPNEVTVGVEVEPVETVMIRYEPKDRTSR